MASVMRRLRAWTVGLPVAALLGSGVAVAAPGGVAASAPPVEPAHGSAGVHPAIALHEGPVLSHRVRGAAPDEAACVAAFGTRCYSPQQLRNAYGLTSLLASGDTGAGQTIVLVESYGSPTAKADLDRFDADYHLPAPPSFRQLAPYGSVPFDPKNGDQVGWAEETSLDVQWAHALAPGASIVVLTSPISETEGVQGLPEFLRLEQYAVSHHLGSVVSQSWSATENTLFTTAGRAVLDRFNAFYQQATAAGVTFLASSGDDGSANPELDGTTLYPQPTVGFPASSPYVTSVGGTTLYADTSGRYQLETTWDDADGATGGGVSQYFAEPGYQAQLPAADQRLLAGHRGVPDVAFNADPETGVPVHLGFLGAADDGYYIFGGTSEGSPAWAGVVADLDQRAGAPLGFLNPSVYALGAAHLLYPAVAHDVQFGSNAAYGVAGYQATPGWDPTTGWGTPSLGLLGDLLVQRVALGRR